LDDASLSRGLFLESGGEVTFYHGKMPQIISSAATTTCKYVFMVEDTLKALELGAMKDLIILDR
jgi:hypothetical protein